MDPFFVKTNGLLGKSIYFKKKRKKKKKKRNKGDKAKKKKKDMKPTKNRGKNRYLCNKCIA